MTRNLSAIEQGNPKAASERLPAVYGELRRLAKQRLAQKKPGQTLQATALVHEAYLRPVDSDAVPRRDSGGHFFAAAAEAMRRILVDNARPTERRRGAASWFARSSTRSTSRLLALDAEASGFLESPAPAPTLKVEWPGFLEVKITSRDLGSFRCRTVNACGVFPTNPQRKRGAQIARVG